jgi:transcriptional regulator
VALYQPPHFARNAPEQRADAIAVMRAHPFATLVSVVDGAPMISHAPLEVRLEDGAVTLLGHFAAPNPHAKALVDGAPVTAIFHGPDGYVSPSWYQQREAVPTWNYVVVHARGRVRRIDDSDGKERVLKALIDRHDSAYHAQWDALSTEYREKMKRGIVAFEIAVDELAAKFKLSQNRSAADRAGVHAAMAQGDAKARALADWMRMLGIAE